MKYASLAPGLIASVLLAALLAACGGGGGTSAAPQGSVSATTAASSVLSTMTINGSPAFVTASQLPVYIFNGDTVANQSACTADCLAVWPSVAPPSGAALTAPWSSFTRSDNGAVQLSFNGKPLYTFVSDSPGVARGDGVQNFSLARPPVVSSGGGGGGGY